MMMSFVGESDTSVLRNQRKFAAGVFGDVGFGN